jgi:hypothetical protein
LIRVVFREREKLLFTGKADILDYAWKLRLLPGEAKGA